MAIPPGINAQGQGTNLPDPYLLDMLVCPVSRVPLRYDADRQELISDQAGLAYPIRDGVPILVAEQARVLEI